jgi:uncharacterized protein
MLAFFMLKSGIKKSNMLQDKSNNESLFISPTYGGMDLACVKNTIVDYINEFPDNRYSLIIGTDSQSKNGSGIDFVIAIAVHRIGHGGIYFWKRIVEHKKMVMQTRIYQEALLSLECAKDFLDTQAKSSISKYDIEIHVDIGKNGKTRDMISEIVGMITASGFAVKTKPDSYCASKVADRHT